MIKKLRAVVADVDGTLALKGGRLMPKTFAAIEKLHQEGILFGIASGRPLCEWMLSQAERWGLSFPFDMAIGMNGGDLYDKKDGLIEHYYPLAPETIRSILTFLKGQDINALVYRKGYDLIYALRMDEVMAASQKRNHSIVQLGDIGLLSEYPTGKIEVSYMHGKDNEIDALIKANQSSSWKAVHTFQGTVEFVDPRVNKSISLMKYAEKNHIALNEIMTFGDQENDLEMLRTSGWGVCLKNGCEACKKAADAITEFSVTEDGFGKYLEMHWFKNTLL